MKKIIHQKIPINKDGEFLISPEMVNKFAQITKKIIGDEYHLIVSPFETYILDEDEIIIHIDCKDYSYNELIEIIEKAKMYDDLNK